MIVPILLYGSEIWGIYGYKEIDTLHLKFCSNKPRVAQFYGELGRFPLLYVLRDH